MVQKEPAIALNSETLSPFMNPDNHTALFSADVLKKCAVIALHVMAEGGRNGDGFQVPELKDEWENGLPKESNVGEWRRSLVGRRKCVFKWLSGRQHVK